MKSVKEVKEEIRASIKKSKKGNPIDSFSRNDFNKLVTTYLNDLDYNMEFCVVKDGKPEERQVPITREFREKVILPILIEAGVDKVEAKSVMEKFSFKQSQTESMYDFIIDVVYQYMDTGKKLNFPHRKDFTGAISLVEWEGGEITSTHRDKDGNKKTSHTRRDKHKTLVKRSSCPAWLRHALS